MRQYELVIGLEVHCQLATKSKLFCGCATDGFGCAPNSRICPVCTAQPGVLPVLNRRAVELAFSAALALDCRLKERSIFARKNYFYPDLPKAYQISQYDEPFSEQGKLIFRVGPATKTVRITRIHMEEDAGKLVHEVGGRTGDIKIAGSLVDFNRAGVPLIEIVSEPDIRSSDEAYAYLTALKEVIQYVGASRCDMEKGEMRCDANISIRPVGRKEFGTRAEIKNLNSFKNVKDAIEYEFQRQVALVESGGKMVQETRLWNVEKQITVSMRSKEDAHDYRYFPDPDLAPLVADARWVSGLKANLPELPSAKRARFIAELGLSSYDSEVLTGDKVLADFFDEAVAAVASGSAKTVTNIITTELLGKLNEAGLNLGQIPVTAQGVAQLADMTASGQISSKGVKDVFAIMWQTRKMPQDIVIERGMAQVSDESQLKTWVREALKSNPKAAADLRGGKEAAIGAIVGAVMKLSSGKANPALVNKLIKEAVRV